jgi:magnesium-transporting ATPase (P-type)
MSQDRNERNGSNNISHHILPTSSNLLGLCFVILSFMRITKTGLETVIDELVSMAIVVFLVASIFSYASIRSRSRAVGLERIADIIFLCGLALLTVISLVIVFEIA